MIEAKIREPDESIPRLAEGIDLIGEYKDSGYEETPYLARRSDGQVIQLSRLLFLVAEATDGERDFDGIAERVSEAFGSHATADNIRFLIEKKLEPLGVMASEADDGAAPQRLDAPLLGLRYRVRLVPERAVGILTTPFLPLFRVPVMVALLATVIALDVWLLFFHGILDPISEVLYQPALVIAFFAVEIAAMAWHECGHATACRYGGAKPGVVGMGIYVIWFVLYSDVTDSYRLDKAGRLRTDFGGLYFDAIFSLMLAGAYFLTGFEPLLVLFLFNQINALDEMSPFLRLDGYYILSDWTGIPDPFRVIRPALVSLIPGREADASVKAMKPWVRVVITAWVLAVVPVLMVSLIVLVLYGPWFIATAWDSLLMQYGDLTAALRDGGTAEIILGLLNVGSLLVPIVGGTLLFSWISARWLSKVRRWRKRKSVEQTS